MNPTLKNILAIIAGIIIGSLVNMGIIMVSSLIIPPPEAYIPMAYIAGKLVEGKINQGIRQA